MRQVSLWALGGCEGVPLGPGRTQGKADRCQGMRHWADVWVHVGGGSCWGRWTRRMPGEVLREAPPKPQGDVWGGGHRGTLWEAGAGCPWGKRERTRGGAAPARRGRIGRWRRRASCPTLIILNNFLNEHVLQKACGDFCWSRAAGFDEVEGEFGGVDSNNNDNNGNLNNVPLKPLNFCAEF